MSRPKTPAGIPRHFQEADHVLGLGRNTRRAIDDGHIAPDRGRRWITDLAQGPFYASFTLVAVVCTR
ncbi:hypothetical protein [Streptomyces sp. NPDC005012]|uniref:hypothetical protein n=1 Tax=unclassified Streptomyces TaxID=2593676 RepID=UPI0033ADF0D6